ncbi:MAG TPA: regulatory protein RecX [Bryobacteraceae bacterium]|nr:regulatory protein RecX [Bryobacteraceae bacterium]
MPRKTPTPLDANALWEYALRTLSVRAYSVAELREKLRVRAARPEDVPEALSRLKERGYMNDERLAENFAVSRLENQGIGKARVIRDLRKRRVAPAVAERAATEAYRDSDEVTLIEAYLRRKYRTVPLETAFAEPKALASAYRRLRTAGFSTANSIRVLKRFAKAAEMLDAIEDDDSSTNEPRTE